MSETKETKVQTQEKNEEKIIFYCKDCEQVVDTEKCGKKYVYKCKLCGTKNVAFGSTKSIRGFFRLDEKEKMKKKKEKA